jgi:hypothetical protein
VGWGINLAHQGTVIFATWFTYGQDGKPWWLVLLADQTAPNVFSGPVSTVTGSAYDAPAFDPAHSIDTAIGSATLTFADGNHATFQYTLNDPSQNKAVAQTKAITRQVFAEPGTVCQ